MAGVDGRVKHKHVSDGVHTYDMNTLVVRARGAQFVRAALRI